MKLRGIGRLAVALACASTASAQTTSLASATTSGAVGNGASGLCSLSADGRFIAFISAASNLVAGDSNGFIDIFVRDRLLGTIQRASVSSAGAEGNGHAGFGGTSISADGRFVGFLSAASNLVSGDTNNGEDVFVRDLQSATTERVSLTATGGQANTRSTSVAISADGRCVAFTTMATNIVAGATGGRVYVYLRDRQAGTTECVSIATGGTFANGDCTEAEVLSPDARFVVFTSTASNLVAGDTNGVADVFVRDRLNATTERVSVSSTGAQGNFAGSYANAISADGRFVAFSSAAANLVVGDNNGFSDVFVRDRANGTTERVTGGASGAEANSNSSSAQLSPDGRYVAYMSLASNLVAGDVNAQYDVFLHDRVSGTDELVSIATNGAQGDGASNAGLSLSRDARFIAFGSNATNFVAGDTNVASDVFVRDRACNVCAFCTAGTTTHGCVPSITGSGNASASSATSFTINVANVEGQRQGILFYGVDNSTFAPLAWGASSSWLCIKPPAQRTGAQNSGGTVAGCDGTLSLNWNAFVAAHPAALGAPFAAGQRVFAQGWFRDPTSPKSTMLSDALEFLVQP